MTLSQMKKEDEEIEFQIFLAKEMFGKMGLYGHRNRSASRLRSIARAALMLAARIDEDDKEMPF